MKYFGEAPPMPSTEGRRYNKSSTRRQRNGLLQAYTKRASTKRSRHHRIYLGLQSKTERRRHGVQVYKARICCDGSKQQYDIDYDETFAPVANATTIRTVLAAATHQNVYLRQHDIKLAFISSTLDRPIYMKQPVGADEGTRVGAPTNFVRLKT